MCQFKYTRHSCGHTLLKLEETHDPSCKLCVPVMVALKYYHDQPTQVCIENTLQQPPIRIPKPCRAIQPNSSGDAEEIARTYARDRRQFEEIMNKLGVTLAERRSIELLAYRHNHTSKRVTNVTAPLRPVCPNNIQFMMELERWQNRLYQPPNITYNTVSWGCGGTGPGDCLVGWTGRDILMYRHGIWNVNPPHPGHARSPLPIGYLCIDYGEAPVLQLPERWRASATRTLIDIPMYQCLYAALYGRPPGPMILNDQGYLVSALGASGPEVPIGPHFPLPPPPISSAVSVPQLPISSVHMGQLRPPQAFVSAARLRQGPGHRYSATWNSPASINQAAGGSKPNEAQKRRTDRNHKERYGHSQTEAGRSQPVDRAEITTKIKELPQRRASRSRNATPTSTTSAGVSQPVYSIHPTPGSTRPATPAGNVSQSDETTTGLGIIHELPPAASVEAMNQNEEDTVLYQPSHHPIPQPHETEAETSASEEKILIRPLPSRQTSTPEPSRSPNPNIKLPSAPEDIPFDMSSNIFIGAEQPPPQELTPPQPPSQTPHPNPIIQNIAISTSHMTQYAAHLTAQQQQVPGVTYTLNPTAEPFEPASPEEGGDRKSEA